MLQNFIQALGLGWILWLKMGTSGKFLKTW